MGGATYAVLRAFPGGFRDVAPLHRIRPQPHASACCISGACVRTKPLSDAAKARRAKAEAKIRRIAHEVRTADEILRASEATDNAVQVIPLDALTDVTRDQVKEWVSAIKRLPGARRKLFIDAIEAVDDTFKTQERYRNHLKSIQMVIEEATTSNQPAVVTKATCFDPRVAIEIAKLSYALRRGHSFVIHLLALYGLRAISDGLMREGITPPSSIPSIPRPASILEADQARALLLSRSLRKGQDGLSAYGPSLDPEVEELLGLDEDESTFIFDEDAGEDLADHDTYAEIGERL